MLRSRTLFVLGRIGAAPGDGDEEVVKARVAAFAELDPVARVLVRRRVTRAVVYALHDTEKGHDERHVHRLAFLELAGLGAVHPDDVDAVRESFDEATAGRRPPSRRGVLAGCLAVAIALSVGGATAAWVATRPAAPLREELPPSRGAWVGGGRPDPGTAEQRALFEERLPRWTVALDAVRRGRGTGGGDAATLELRRAHDAVVADALAHLGPDATSFLRAVLDQSEAIVLGDSAEATDSHLRSVDAFNASVAALGLGYYVDAEVAIEIATGRGRVYLSTFVVERVTAFTSDDDRVRALRLRRLDRLNFARAVLGFTRPQVVDALVLGERVEDFLVRQLLPGLAAGEAMPLVDPDTRAESPGWLVELETAAAADARREAVALVGDEERVEPLGALFARRARLFDGLADRLAQRGIGLRAPPTYGIERPTRLQLERYASPEEARELDAIVNELDDDELRGTYGVLEEAFVRSIERHEVQHRLDYLHETLDSLPSELERLTGPLRVGDRDNALAQSANAELSAYLAELARGPAIVRTNLALFLRHVVDRRRWGSGECYAALVVLEGLARELDLTSDPLVVSRAVDQGAVARLYVTLRERPTEELVRAAGSLWAELYRRPLPPLQ